MATNNFFGQIRNQMTGTRNQMFQNEMKGRAFNLEMDKEARNFFSTKANQVVNDTVRDIQALELPANELESFEFFRDGTMSFSPSELRKVASLQWDRDPQLQNQVDKRTYQDSYIKNYTSESGFDAAAVGTNKKIGQLGYNEETDTYSPTVLTYDPERRQVYEADFTVGGKKVALGGEPMDIPGYAFDKSLRNYMINMQRELYDVNTTGVVADLYAVRGDRSNIMEGIGTPGSFDPTKNIEIREGLERDFAGMTPPTSTTTSTSVSTTDTTNVAPEMSTSGTDTVTPLTSTSETGVLNQRTQEPLNAQELNRMVKGPNGVARFINQMDPNNEYIYTPGTVPVDLSVEQFEAYPPAMQTSLITEAKKRSDANISSVYNAGIADIRSQTGEVSQANLLSLREEAARQRTIGDSGDRGRMAGGTAYLDRADQAVQQAEAKQNANAVMAFYDGGVEGVLQNHPTYFEEFKQMGAAAFAEKYKDDPEFAKNDPSPKKVAQTKVTINQIEKQIKKDTGITFNQDGSVVAPDGGGKVKTTTFKDALSFPQATSTAVENTTSLVLQDALDQYLGEFDLRKYNRKHRMILTYAALGSLPEAERDKQRKNMLTLAEYGVSSVRYEAEKGKDLAGKVNTAYQIDQTQNRDANTFLFDIIKAEDTDDRNNIAAANNAISQLNSLRSYTQNKYNYITDAQKTNREWFTTTDKALKDLFAGSAFAQRDTSRKISGIDAATFSKQLDIGDAKEVVNSPVFTQHINKLEQYANAAQTQGERLAIQGQIDNTLSALVRAKSDHWFLNWWRGAAPLKAGDLSANIIFLDGSGQPMYDMNQVQGPNNPNGTRPAEIRLIDGSATQKGKSISPDEFSKLLGQEWYTLLLSHATENANRIRYGEI